MPVINIEFDGKKVKKKEILALSEAAHEIVSGATRIEDVPVYANSAEIAVKIAPVDIFVQMSEHKIKDVDKLVAEIKSRLLGWKKENKFPHPINLTVVPMKWKIEIGI